jgi:cholesterol transport system auxiliary component
MKAGRRVWILGIVLTASGCTGLLQREAVPEQTYLLRAASASAPPGSASSDANSPSLRIGRTLTAPGLENDRIMLVRSDHRVDFYVGSRWLAAVPQMIEDLATETLRGSGAWASVHDSQGAFPTDYFLQLDIRRFEADYTESTNPRVRVVLECTLGRRMDRERVSHFVAQATVAADENRMSSVVAAFESATQQSLAVISERAAEVLRTSTAQSTP